MTTQQVLSTIWQRMVNQSFLSLYQAWATEATDTQHYDDYDFVFEFSDKIVYVLVTEVNKEYKNQTIDASQIREWRMMAVNELIKRHTQLYNKNSSASINKQLTTPIDASEKATYYVGLTSLSVLQRDTQNNLQSHSVEYEYGSQFFAEDCVLDLDDEQRVLQVFSQHNFVNIIKRLVTPSDFSAFLGFHRNQLTEMKPFKDESALLQRFMQSPEFYQLAIAVQKQLVANKLLDEVEPRLLKAIQPSESDFALELAQDIHKKSEMWYQLFNTVVRKYHEAETPLPKAQVDVLVDESMFTYASLIEQILDYKFMDKESRWNGYISHQHSYSRFGRHYMMVFYAQYGSSALSRDNVRVTNQDLLLELNSHLQDPTMEDLFLIGVDFRDSESSVNTEVFLDVFHKSGTVVTAEMQSLYDQLAKLKEKP